MSKKEPLFCVVHFPIFHNSPLGTEKPPTLLTNVCVFGVKTIQKYRKKPWNSTVCVQFSLFSYTWTQCRLSNINELFSARMTSASVPHHSQTVFGNWTSAICRTPTPKQFLCFIVKLLMLLPVCVYFQVAVLWAVYYSIVQCSDFSKSCILSR